MSAEIFEITPNIAPYELFKKSNNHAIPILFMKWIVKGSMSYLITGDQGSGKTTALKSFIRFYPPSAALRINELQPEMNLRYAYSDRNIISFSETADISTQEGLNFQKKTSGTYNIIGEIASAEAAAWYVQTCKVASKAGAGTHHGKTVKDTITAIADNLAQVSGSSDIKAMERKVADAIDFDMHMDRVGKLRYCQRISEIQVVQEEDYPYSDIDTIQLDCIDSLAGCTPLETIQAINKQEFYRRLTDRKTFTSKNLCEYNMKENVYIQTGMFSDNYIERIRKNVTEEEYEEFERDMDVIEQTNRDYYKSA